MRPSRRNSKLRSSFLSYKPAAEADTGRNLRRTTSCSADIPASDERQEGNYTIFDGTSEIQRLITARAISRRHIQ
jgi:hypothetical protein